MKLGYSTGYWSSGPPEGAVEAIAECDRLGYEHIWTAEAYGSDALTPLAWWGAATENVKLGPPSSRCRLARPPPLRWRPSPWTT